MAYTPEQYDGARQWAAGKTGAEIFAKGKDLGLGLNDYSQIFNATPDQVQSLTGFGSASGVRPDANTWTYNADNSWARDSAIPQQGSNMGGGRGPSPVQMPEWSQYQGYQENPYLQQQASGIAQSATRALNEQMLPGVRSEAIAAGGFGGSRQGIAEGLAMGRTSDAISGAVGNLYSTDYQNSMNRNLQRYQTDVGSALGMGQLDATNRGIDNSFALGLGGLNMQQRGLDNQYALGQAGLNMQGRGLDNQLLGINNQYDLGLKGIDQNRYSTDKSYDVGMANASAAQSSASAAAANAAANQALGQGRLAFDQQQYGGNMMMSLLDRQMAYNNAGITAGGNIQNTPLNYWNQFSQGANSIGQGYGTSTASGGGGNPMMGMLGGAQLGSQFGNMFNSSNNYSGSAGGVSGYADYGLSSGGNGAWI